MRYPVSVFLYKYLILFCVGPWNAKPSVTQLLPEDIKRQTHLLAMKMILRIAFGRMDEDIRPFLSRKKKVEGRHKGNLKSKRINVDLASVFPKCFNVDVIRNDKEGFIRT